MKRVLAVQSSPFGASSVSRQLVDVFCEVLAASDRVEIVGRDLAAKPTPHLRETTIGAFFTPPDQRTEEQKRELLLSDELIGEFLGADLIVLGVPMHNFGLPSGLKAYIDHIVRVDQTFHYTPEGPQGLVKDKEMLVLTARGGVYEPGSPMHLHDHQEGYLRSIFGFVGIDELSFIHCEGMALDTRAVSIAKAKERVAAFTRAYLG